MPLRLWSLHPKYLDAKGLVALWREALLAKHVLEGKTKGYRYHPQLLRFKSLRQPQAGIHKYLEIVYAEALNRGYNFDRRKFKQVKSKLTIPVTIGQMQFEFNHLLKKLKKRDPKKWKEVNEVSAVNPHPLFRKVRGGIEEWEIVP